MGLPDKDYGDAVSAIIVLEEKAKRDQEKSKPVLSLQELCTWAKDKLAPYKVLLLDHLSICFLFLFPFNWTAVDKLKFVDGMFSSFVLKWIHIDVKDETQTFSAL